MPTTEERLSALEKTVSVLEKKLNDADLESVNHNATMLLGLSIKHQSDIHEIKNTLSEHAHTLNEHTRILNEHSAKLDNIELEIQQIKTKSDQHTEAINENTKLLTQIVALLTKASKE
jgi:chromosome segregation ATPase